MDAERIKRKWHFEEEEEEEEEEEVEEEEEEGKDEPSRVVPAQDVSVSTPAEAIGFRI